MKVLIVLLTFFACSSAVVGFSCYQNFTATSLIWNRKFYSISPCPSSSTEQACVKATGTLNTLLGGDISGQLVYGHCVNATACSNLTCAYYNDIVKKINPFFRLKSCNVSCCYTSNCNSNSPLPLPTLPSPTNATSPVTYRPPPLPVAVTGAIPPPVVETTPKMPPLPTTKPTVKLDPQATRSDKSMVTASSQAVALEQEMTTSGSRDVKTSAYILALVSVTVISLGSMF
uniref:UPAR/Ly6 domain-containing protein n=2 Tax=Ciona savignyi TaxID=51511 RepID=H2ZB45_CIOSA